MSHNLPMNATLPGNVSVLPESWVTRLFSRLEALYGSRFHELWKGTNPENVKAVWAEKLGGFSGRPDVIKAALDACDDRPWPPNLPEFLDMCRTAARVGGRAHIALAAPEPLSKEEAKKRLDELQSRFLGQP